MSGANLYQRETLTVNHGIYYVDTAVKMGTQQKEPYSRPDTEDFNLFEAGQTYYMFFLYAKKETHQTYQIYVGNSSHIFSPWAIEDHFHEEEAQSENTAIDNGALPFFCRIVVYVNTIMFSGKDNHLPIVL